LTGGVKYSQPHVENTTKQTRFQNPFELKKMTSIPHIKWQIVPENTVTAAENTRQAQVDVRALATESRAFD